MLSLSLAFEVTDDEETSTEIVEVAGQVQALQENVIELSEHIDVKN
jgi:hypothetical protein